MSGAPISSRVGRLVCAGMMLAGAVAPTAAQNVTLSQIGALAGPAELLRVHDGHAYVASGISLKLFLPTTLNSGPACTTKVSPSSLNRKILPL